LHYTKVNKYKFEDTIENVVLFNIIFPKKRLTSCDIYVNFLIPLRNCGQTRRGASEILAAKAAEKGKKARSIDRISASIWCLKTGAAASRRSAVRVRPRSTTGLFPVSPAIYPTFAARNKLSPANIRIFIGPEKNNK